MYANANPTVFIDPTGHESFRQWMFGHGEDSYAKAFGKAVLYNAWNVVSLGTLGRQDTLVEQSEAGKITESQYWSRTGLNAATSGATLGMIVATGGAGAAATTSGSAFVWGAAGGVATAGVSDIGQIYGTRTKSIDEVSALEYAGAALLGGLGGVAARQGRLLAEADSAVRATPKGGSEPAVVTEEAPRAGGGDVSVAPAKGSLAPREPLPSLQGNGTRGPSPDSPGAGSGAAPLGSGPAPGATRSASTQGDPFAWRVVRQRINAGPAPARSNPAFPRGIERRELSHWLIPRRAPVPNWIKNREWNLKSMWGSEHAMADPARYQFMPSAWKAQHPLPNGLARFWNRTPAWAQWSAVGAGTAAAAAAAYSYLSDDGEAQSDDR